VFKSKKTNPVNEQGFVMSRGKIRQTTSYVAFIYEI